MMNWSGVVIWFVGFLGGKDGVLCTWENGGVTSGGLGVKELCACERLPQWDWGGEGSSKGDSWWHVRVFR